MKKLAKIINTETKIVSVALSETPNMPYFTKKGYVEMDVEEGWDGNWYQTGYVPPKPEETYTEKRMMEYPSMSEQLDMLYWDAVNQTNTWVDLISTIKNKYPK